MTREPDPGPGAAPAAGRRGVDTIGGASVAAASLLFGCVVILGKIVTDQGYPILTLLALRFGLAACLMAAVLAVTRQPLRAAPGEGWRLAALGVAGYACESTLFFLGLRHGGPAAVTLLFFTYPVWVTILAVATGKGRPSRLVLGSLGAAVAGAALVVVGSGGLEITTAGIVFSLASAVVFALYLTGADAVLVKTNSLTGAMWVSGAAGLALAVAAAVSGNASLPVTPHRWISVIAIAAGTAGAFFCLFVGLRRLGAVRTSIIAASEPLCAAVLSVVFLHEQVFLGTVVGGLLILAAAVTAALARGDDARANPPGRPVAY